jgi:hypothetical protein
VQRQPRAFGDRPAPLPPERPGWLTPIAGITPRTRCGRDKIRASCRREVAMPLTGPFIRTAALVVFVSLLTPAAARATVILTLDRSLFLASNPIVITETFDETPVFLFPEVDHAVTVDEVTWFDPGIDPGWVVAPPLTGGGSPPHALFSRMSIEDENISFAGGRAVKAFGFTFLPFGLGPRFRFLVEETDGALSITPPFDDVAYLGFSSTRGIQTIFVLQETVDGVRTNFAYDDVSRSKVIPEPAPGLLLALAGALLAARSRRHARAAGDSNRRA